MAIAERFFRYLDHIRPSHTLDELARDPRTPGRALRHDIDHDLDLALEMAFWERENGVRASYYLLHTAPYWSDSRLDDACRQLVTFGHEVGLHVNVMAEWAKGESDDPEASLTSALARLRDAGAVVTGTAAHGDRACYERGIINYWCFSELRGAQPQTSEDGLTAEGIAGPTDAFRVHYPPDHAVRRPDGAVLPLWQTSMASLGLEYEAVKVATDGYFTDSGGSWTRSPDPMDVKLDVGRHQVLLHPEYWRGPQRLYLFLSTARSGSTWLAKVLDEASSVTARHEFSLNHRFQDGALTGEKRTGAGFTHLLDRPAEVRQLLAEARTWMEEVPGDVADANVYLAHVPDGLDEVFPDATAVHLVRDPHRVVRSILARDWYDTPNDDRHPAMPLPGWDGMSQVEKAGWYARCTTERLAARTTARIRLEDVSKQPHDLSRALRQIGIAFYPELARSFFDVVNAGVRAAELSAALPASSTAALDGILAPVRRTLGYERGSAAGRLRSYARDLRARRARRRSSTDPTVTTELANHRFDVERPALTTVGFEQQKSAEGFPRYVPDGARHAHILLGGSTWHRTDEQHGWAATVGALFRLELEAHADGAAPRLFCLMYDGEGRLVHKRLLRELDPGGTTRAAFRTRADARRFDIALYSSTSELPVSLNVSAFSIEQDAPSAPGNRSPR